MSRSSSGTPGVLSKGLDPVENVRSKEAYNIKTKFGDIYKVRRVAKKLVVGFLTISS